MPIKKISNNVQNVVKRLISSNEKKSFRSQFDSNTLSLIDDIQNNGPIWTLSQSEPIIFAENTKRPWHYIMVLKKWVHGFVLYQNCLYEVCEDYSEEQIRLLVLDDADSERKKFERLKAKHDKALSIELQFERVPIPEQVRIAVWRRDQGKCVRCGSKEFLEYDHIIPLSKGGSNTARNIELLCEKCNREKSNNIQ